MAGETVTVACKLPHGLFLRLQKPAKQTVVAGGVAHEADVWVWDGGPVIRVNGFARAAGKVPQAQIVGAERAPDGGTHGGYALTHGVPKDFWMKWVSQNKDADCVTKKLIFAYDKADSAEGAAREHKGELSGLEPLNTNAFPAEFRRKNSLIEAA